MNSNTASMGNTSLRKENAIATAKAKVTMNAATEKAKVSTNAATARAKVSTNAATARAIASIKKAVRVPKKFRRTIATRRMSR